MHLLSKLVALSLSTSSTQNLPSQGGLQPQQLSWQELGELLLDLQTRGVPDAVLMNTRLSSLPLSRVCVGPSRVGGGTGEAGRGVFATVNCQPGDLLTCYPGDILLHPTNGFTPQPKEKGIADDETLRDLMSRYCIGITDEHALLGLPQLDQDPAYIGHLINDGIDSPPEQRDQLEAYMEESQSKANAQLIPLENLHMVAIATREIQKDDEVFIFYGPIYWMDHTSTWKGGTLE